MVRKADPKNFLEDDKEIFEESEFNDDVDENDDDKEVFEESEFNFVHRLVLFCINILMFFFKNN